MEIRIPKPAIIVPAGKLDKAEPAARNPLERFLDVHDGWDRLEIV